MTQEEQSYYEDLKERVGYLYELVDEAERDLNAGDLRSAYNAFMRAKRQMPKTELTFGVLINGLI